jgi:hypothetical protein
VWGWRSRTRVGSADRGEEHGRRHGLLGGVRILASRTVTCEMVNSLCRTSKSLFIIYGVYCSSVTIATDIHHLFLTKRLMEGEKQRYCSLEKAWDTHPFCEVRHVRTGGTDRRDGVGLG